MNNSITKNKIIERPLSIWIPAIQPISKNIILKL